MLLNSTHLAKQLKMMRLLAMFSMVLTRNTIMLSSPQLMETQAPLLMISAISSTHMICAMMNLKILAPSPLRQTSLAVTLVPVAAALIVAARTTEEVEVVVEEVATAVIAEIMIAALTTTGVEMKTAVKGTGTVMMTGMTAVMIGMTVVLMVVVVGTLARTALARIVPLPHMLIEIARYARYMATLREPVGGITLMTKMMMAIVMRRVHTLLSMASTPTGTPIWGPPTTSPLS
jgi:hypothetical protein